MKCIIALLIFAIFASAQDQTKNPIALLSRNQTPQILAHRGASGYIPEHSLQAYETAINLGTDYIEPDLCLTKDGVFVALHDLLLDDTTNVADLPQFASYKSTKVVDGETVTGWFISDFTYAETQQLRLNQRLPFRTQLYNSFFQIPTLQQIISLSLTSYNATGRLVGLYIELKHPAYFAPLFNMPDMLLAQLAAAGFEIGQHAPNDIKSSVVPIIIQCFEPPTLQYIHSITSIPLVQLVNPPTAAQLADGSYWTQAQLESIAMYASAVGPEKTFFSSLSIADGRAAVALAKSIGLTLHPWTFRAEQQYIGTKFNASFEAEQTYFLCCLEVGALFTEFPDLTREVIQGLAAYSRSTEAATAPCPMTCE